MAGERTPVPGLVGARRPEVLVLNDDDLTYAKVRLDGASLAAKLEGIALFATTDRKSVV